MNNRTILIVDDSDLDRLVLAGFLKKQYNILEAENGEEAIKIMRRKFRVISAIVMDIMMPCMDGFEALKKIKANVLWSQIPVIITTNLDDDESREKAIVLGADGFVTKPYSRALLLHVVQNAVRLREMAAIANTLWRDHLTRLLSRESFFIEARRYIACHKAGYYMLSCLNVENFKVINDLYGTETGDEVLKYIANCLNKSSTGIDGLACRYAADKFAILFPAKLKDSAEVSENHVQAMRPPCLNRPIRIRVGRYLVSDPTLSVSAMFDRASMAEASVKGRYDVYIAEYSESMRVKLLHDQQIVNEMEGALEAGEFEAWFQPQYNHATGALIGSEALVRWRKGGVLIPPGEFIPVFERNGFIYEVDQRVWRQVCALIRRWLDEGKAPLPVSVNISRCDLFQNDFLDVICGLVNEYGLPADLLRLEITESAFAESSKTIVHMVNELIKRGFTVEIDDFGSGYSSLNTLKDVPASILKLDMKFFENSGNAQRSGNIIESVVRMAKWLDMTVIAEGVENREQADYLKSIGCYYIQGYYYARPMPMAEYEKLCAAAAKEHELTRLKTLETLDNSAFWDPKSMETLIFNSYVGGASIFEYANGQTELLRANEQYARELGGLVPAGARLKDSSIVRFLDQEGREKLCAAMREAIMGKHESSCEVRLSDGKREEYVRVTVRLIARAAERLMFYCVIQNMTRQREAERKQMESARQLEVIMSNINGGVSAIQINDDGTSHFVFSNSRYHELYGYTLEEAQTEKLDVMTLIMPEDKPSVMAKIRKLKADGQPALIDYRITKRDGRRALLRANASLISIAGYGDDVIASVITDITEKKSLEEQLRAIVDNIFGGVAATVIRNGSPEFVVVNDQFFKLLGYNTREEYEAASPDKYAGIHPDDRERIVRQFESSDGGKKEYAMNYRIIRRDGAVRYMLNNIRVINLFGVDDPVQLSVVNDVTELREAQMKERQTAAKLKAVLDHAGVGITAMALRESGSDFLFANDKYFELLGYTREEYAKATESSMFAVVHPDDREKMRSLVTGYNDKSGENAVEYRAIRGDGRTAWIRSIITVTRLEGIETPVQIAMFSDVTARRAATAQLQFLNDSARDILAQPDSESAIHGTLKKLMAYFAADRGYVVELDHERNVTRNTYEVCAPGVLSQKNSLEDIPFGHSDSWYASLMKSEYLAIDDVNGLDKSQAELRALLSAQGIRSIIIAPLRRDGELIGFAGVDNPSESIDQIKRLGALADYISVLLTRRDLTRKIERSRQAIQTLLDDTPGGFARMEIRPGGHPAIVCMNAGLCRMLGMTRDEVMEAYGGDAYKCLLAEDIAAATADSAEALASCGAFSSRCRLRCKDGGLLWVMVFGRFVKDEAGKLFLNSYFTDISEQKKAEELQIKLLDNLPCGAALYEYNGKGLSVIHINKRYWELVEREPADYSSSSVFSVIHADDRAMIHQEIEAAIRQKRNASADIRILCGKSAYKPFHVTANLTPKGDGTLLCFVSYTPISDRAMSIQEMLPVALSTMMSASDDLSYVKGRDLRYVCCSESVVRMLALPSGRDIVGKTDFDLFDREIAKELTSRGSHVIESGEAQTGFVEKIPGLHGKTLLVSTSLYPIRDASGGVVGLYGTSRDITAQREQASQLELLANSIPGGIATFSCAHGNIRLDYYNDGLCGLFGLEREAFAQKTAEGRSDPLEFVFREDRNIIGKQLEALIKDGTPVDCVFRIHVRPGGFKWVSCKAAAVDRAADGCMVNAVLTDITEQQEEKERLRVSEELNRLASEQSGNIITRFDVRRRTLTLPDSLPPIFKLPHVLNDMPWEQIALGRVSPDTVSVYTELFEDIVRGQSAGTATFRQNSSLGWRWLEAHYTTIFSNAGEPVSAVVSFTDVTEKLEKELVYNKWQQSLQNRSEESYTLFRCNLSRNASYDSWEGKLLRVKFSSKAEATFDERTLEYVEQSVYQEDRERYLAFVNANTMLAEYYRGHRSDSLEFREIDAAGAVRWLRLTVDLVEYPNSRDIEAYLMFENIDKAKRRELKTIERAETDPMTGLLNRAAFAQRVDELIGESEPGVRHALLMLDVDGFKQVNDVFGHDAGDRALTDIAELLRNGARRGDLVGRLGGDEFVVLLSNIPDESIAAKRAQQICELTRKTFSAGVSISSSVGIALYPRDGTSFETLYKKADKTLYYVKGTGKNNYAFCRGGAES